MKKYERLENITEVENLLIVVDMVNGFVKEGVMADPYINHIVPEIKRLVEEFLTKQDAVFFIKEAHEKGSAEFKKFPEHCVKGTSEAKLIDELKVYEKYASRVYGKNSTSTVWAPNFMQDLNSMKNLKEVLIVGCCTDICVMDLTIPVIKYFDQENKEVNVIVPENAVETYDAPFHNRDEYNDMAKKFMKQAGISLVKKY